MKNYRNILFILLLSVLVFACDEESFVDEVPISSQSVKSFFETTDQFNQAVIGVYSPLRSLSQTFFSQAAEIRSDNTTFQHNSETQSGYNTWDMDKFSMGGGSEDDNLDPAWDNFYGGISRANNVLLYIEDKEIDKKDQFIAEAKFLRAFYYFNLVRYWGNVPLVTKVVESNEEAFELNTQVAPDLVYDQIISDLNDAKVALPKSYSSVDVGRATEGAARMLLAKVLMWRGQYGEAATELETIVNSNQYSLLDNYPSIFSAENSNNAEIVFDVQNIEGAAYGQSSNYMYRFIPWNLEAAATEVYGFPFRILGSGSNGHNIPTGDLIDSFEEGDIRKDMIELTFIDKVRPVYRDSIVPFTKKYLDYNHAREGQTGVHYPIFRYPHVLLSLAECYLREGGGNPLPLLNQVRERAQLEALSSVTLADILHERRVEFNCECDRWDVLLRTGLAKEVMEAHAVRERKRVDIPNSAFQKIKLLFPIPASQLSVDKNLKQNPEYL